MFDFLSSVKDAMLRHDIFPPYIDLNSRSIVRFKSDSLCRKNCCFYILLPNRIGIIFGCWRRDIHVKWFAKSFNKLTFHEQNQYKIQLAKFEKEKEEKRKVALLRCQNIWDKSREPSLDHPYLIRKKIKPIYIRQYGDNLVIPIYDFSGNLQSLQTIQPDGFKLFEEGSSYRNGYLPMGESIVAPIRLCEGYSTGASIYEAIGSPVLICFTANNLINIAKWIRNKYPSLEIHICADDDRKTELKIGKNVGLLSAIEAAKSIKAHVVYPDFTYVEYSQNATDFNDLMCLAGIEIVENQLLNGVIHDGSK